LTSNVFKKSFRLFPQWLTFSTISEVRVAAVTCSMAFNQCTLPTSLDLDLDNSRQSPTGYHGDDSRPYVAGPFNSVGLRFPYLVFIISYV